MPNDPVNKNTTTNSKKIDDLQQNMEDATGQFLTTNQGLKVNDDQNSLKAGERGPSLLEDFILREKITHFDHERIPERVVHARGSAAHGVFKLNKDLSEFIKEEFESILKEKGNIKLRVSKVIPIYRHTHIKFVIKFLLSASMS